MNKEKAIMQLIELLTPYNSYGFLFHRKFLSELKTLVTKLTGQEKSIFSKLIKQLRYVKDYGYDVDKADSNEILKNVNTPFPCYSLHIEGKQYNIRLLMTFQYNKAIFLVAFQEKSGKANTDYTNPIKKARNRMRGYNE